jgi:hypothetical protein
MVRTELLRAKSLHAEVHYLQDLKRVGEVKRLHDQQSKTVREKENQFWKEAIKGQKHPSAQAASPEPRTVQQTATQIERMWKAHGQLKEAHQKRETSAQKLQEGLTTLSNSKQRIDSLQKLVSKAEKIRANRLESRMSEEVAELVGTTRAIAALKGGFEERGVNPSLSEAAKPPTTPVSLLVPMDDSLIPPASVIQKGIEAPHAQPTQPVSFVPPTKVELSASRAAELSAPASPALQIQTVQFEKHETHAALTVNASMGSASPVRMVITKGEGNGLKVLVDPGVGTLAGTLTRDKSIIQSRLQALGIKVSSLEVGSADTSPQQARRNSRKHTTDQDEELIA